MADVSSVFSGANLRSRMDKMVAEENKVIQSAMTKNKDAQNVGGKLPQ